MPASFTRLSLSLFPLKFIEYSVGILWCFSPCLLQTFSTGVTAFFHCVCKEYLSVSASPAQISGVYIEHIPMIYVAKHKTGSLSVTSYFLHFKLEIPHTAYPADLYSNPISSDTYGKLSLNPLWQFQSMGVFKLCTCSKTYLIFQAWKADSEKR